MNTAVPNPLAVLEDLVARAAENLAGDLVAEQVQLYELAFARAELSAAAALRASALERAGDPLVSRVADYYEAEVYGAVLARLAARPQAFDLDPAELPSAWLLAERLEPSRVAELGSALASVGIPIHDDNDEQRVIRSTFADFADRIVAPHAEAIHREDLMVPAEILEPLKAMGAFGLCIPEQYGGSKPDAREDSLGMVIVTEELSRGSLGAAGSLITRPEIMARAILEGGTAEQKAHWLPRLATGESLCAISVTEPGTGSDVAAVALRAKRTEGGWLLNGGKTWCTFAGKADAVLVLARTDQDAKPPHRGLSLFIVEKPSGDGHDFRHEQPGGGVVSGRAIATIGYRGMHSYEMFYDDFFVPDACLVGESQGQGRGFYFTMRGFMGGRLQTAARACGLMRAAYDAAVEYGQARRVFSLAVADFPLTQAKYAKMAAAIMACRAFTAEVAGLMDEGQGATEASLVKLLACRAAEQVTREALQIHGGMGYAEESAVSRYYADARVLSIFEGAEETLAIRVIGKAMTG